MDLTILIPTKNRHFHLKKILNYYKDFNFSGKIFIFDSSDIKIFKKNSNIVKKQNNSNISLFKYQALPFQCFKKYQKLIKTKYVCYSGDDDFFLLKGLKKMIEFLERNKSAAGVNGTTITLGLLGKNYNKTSSFGIYKNFASSKNNSILRLNDLMSMYLVPLFSLFRTKIFIKMLKVVPNKNEVSSCPSRAVNDELLESFYLTFLGRIFHKPYPYLIRTVSNLDKGYKLDHNEKGYEKSYNYLQKKIIEKIKNKKDYDVFNKNFNKFIRNRLKFLKSIKPKKFKLQNNFFIIKTIKFFYFKIKLNYFLFNSKDFKLFYNVINWIKNNN